MKFIAYLMNAGSLSVTAGALLLSLALARTPTAQAQGTNTLSATNELSQAEDMTADNSQDDQVGSDDNGGTNDVAATNSPGSATEETGRSRRLRRQRQNRSRTPVYSGEAGVGGASVSPLDFSAFKLVIERNIFDPNRAPHEGPRVQPKTLDSFSLVGTLSYAKGDFAFFDGTSADYKKVLKANDTIAGYKVVAVGPDSVKLEQGTNRLDLAVGVQMRHQETGGWVQSSTSTSYSAAPAAASNSSSSASSSAPSGADADILKRMMERREKE